MSETAKGILEEAGAVLSGHFVYTSGNHGPDYINKDAVYTNTRYLDALCDMMAFWLFNQRFTVDVVAAPAIGGVNLATGVARKLSELTGKDILVVYAEPEEHVVFVSEGHTLATLELNSITTSRPSPGGISMFNDEKLLVRKKRMEFRRGYDALVRRKSVVVVEDVLNTGGSAKKVVEEAQMLSADVPAVVALCNRGGVTVDQLGVHYLHALVDIQMPMYAPNSCPLCEQKVPVNINVGKGKAFLAAQGQQS